MHANSTQDFVIVIIGETGVGKSTLANILLGKKHFKTSNSAIDAKACTRKAEAYKGKFLGLDNEDDIIVVDTQGYTDPSIRDYENTQHMINLIKSFPLIKIFLIVFNGEFIRWDPTTKSVLEIFNKSFPGFWDSAHVIINYWADDERSIKRRNMQEKSQESVKKDINKNFEAMFGINHIKADFIDALAYYDASIADECKFLISKLKDLKYTWKFLNGSYDSVMLKPILSEHQKRLKELEEQHLLEKKKNEELQKANAKLQAMNSSLTTMNQQTTSIKAPKKTSIPSMPPAKPSYSDYFSTIEKLERIYDKGSLKDIDEVLECLSRAELQELSDKLDTPRSGNKTELIDNITFENTTTKIIKSMTIGMLRKVCDFIGIPSTGYRDELERLAKNKIS